MKAVEFCFPQLFPSNEAQENISKVRTVLFELYDEYVAANDHDQLRKRKISQVGDSSMDAIISSSTSGWNDFDDFLRQSETFEPQKSELVDYLEKGPQKNGPNANPVQFDCLGWWKMNRIDKIFKRVNSTDQQKVSFPTYKLEGEVDHWWTTIEHMQDVDRAPMTRDHYVEHFHEKYFSESVRDRKEMEFMNLKQGDIKVGQYEAKFLEFSRCASNLLGIE
ncbi:hypothetical protein ACH5RR_018271 [Cinchona calisaya]|uniref:Retrotransposon gag domain-containing protein n=1 Tax=Cinchona calisaya TaxID=153742 RepID=A0ABD2ZKZ3_9GENT